MAEIVSYFGRTGVGMTFVLTEIVKKNLEDMKKVLVVSDEPRPKSTSRNLAVVHNASLSVAISSYNIINNGELPDVVVVDGTQLTELDLFLIVRLKAIHGIELLKKQRSVNLFALTVIVYERRNTNGDYLR